MVTGLHANNYNYRYWRQHLVADLGIYIAIIWSLSLWFSMMCRVTTCSVAIEFHRNNSLYCDEESPDPCAEIEGAGCVARIFVDQH